MFKKRTGTSSRRPTSFRLKPCFFCTDKREPDYKDIELLTRYLSERGKIVSRGRTGICRNHQRKLSLAIKRARALALLPFVIKVK